MAVAVEICLSGGPGVLEANVEAARQGGAQRVELCASMIHQGLTPSSRQMATVAELLGGRVELVVMLRPRPGAFDLTPQDVRVMGRRMRRAASLGATGVALGALKGRALDLAAMEALCQEAHALNLRVTCHRAFDAVSDPLHALDQLMALGVRRVLSAGVPWGAAGGALDGLPRLAALARHAHGGVELVVAGGVMAQTAPQLCLALGKCGTPFSLHAYSSVQERHRVQSGRVRELVKAATAPLHALA